MEDFKNQIIIYLPVYRNSYFPAGNLCPSTSLVDAPFWSSQRSLVSPSFWWILQAACEPPLSFQLLALSKNCYSY